ncbi:alpha/beta hydrolase [Pseudomonas aeruginosa]
MRNVRPTRGCVPGASRRRARPVCGCSTSRLPAAPPVRVRRYRPDRPAPPGGRPALLYLHGGGLDARRLPIHTISSAPTSAARLGLLVLAVDYRPAPEHPFPAALQDCLRARGAEPGRAGRSAGMGDACWRPGDSAGGNSGGGAVPGTARWRRAAAGRADIALIPCAVQLRHRPRLSTAPTCAAARPRRCAGVPGRLPAAGGAAPTAAGAAPPGGPPISPACRRPSWRLPNSIAAARRRRARYGAGASAAGGERALSGKRAGPMGWHCAATRHR